MKRCLLLIIAIAMIVAGGYIGTKDKSYNKVLNNNNNEPTKPETKEDFTAVKKYIDEKYKNSFTVEKLLTTYNASINDGISFYKFDTTATTKEKINVKVYKVKDSNNIYFNIKEVIHNDDKLDVSKYSTIVSKGFYDNYLSASVAKKLESELLTKYKDKYNIKSIKIDEGLGVFKDDTDLLMSHYPKTDDLVNLSITAKELLTKIGKEEFLNEFHKLNLVIEVNTNITKDNFQDEVKKFVEIKKLSLENDLKVDKLTLKYGTRTLSEDYGIVLKENNKKLYDKSIVDYNDVVITGDNTIKYEDFIKLNKTAFNF